MACSAGMMSSEGASRMSSVLGLKVRPRMPTVLPFRSPPSGLGDLVGHGLLARVVDLDRGLDQPHRRAGVARRCAPGPGCPWGSRSRRSRGRRCRNLRPMRLSRPMPRATCCTSAPTASQRSAISLMKVIFIARKALAAYLISSRGAPAGEQDRRLVEEQRAVELAHHRLGALVVGAHHHAVGALEVVDRRALAQELRVGDHGERRRPGARLRMMASISSPVPTGTVDLVTTTVKPSIRPAISSAAA